MSATTIASPPTYGATGVTAPGQAMGEMAPFREANHTELDPTMSAMAGIAIAGATKEADAGTPELSDDVKSSGFQQENGEVVAFSDAADDARKRIADLHDAAVQSPTEAKPAAHEFELAA